MSQFITSPSSKARFGGGLTDGHTLLPPLGSAGGASVVPDRTSPRQELEAVAISERSRPVSYEELYGKRSNRQARRTDGDDALMPARVPYIKIACLSLALAMALVGGRTYMVRAAPALARLYAAMGFPVNLRGLDLRNVKATVLDDNGHTVLGIEGEIVNLTHHAIAVPELAFELRQTNGRALYSWTNPPQVHTLEDGGTALFRARLAAPPEEAQDLRVHFVKQTSGAKREPPRAADPFRDTD